jgi:hypothetical protein
MLKLVTGLMALSGAAIAGIVAAPSAPAGTLGSVTITAGCNTTGCIAGTKQSDLVVKDAPSGTTFTCTNPTGTGELANGTTTGAYPISPAGAAINTVNGIGTGTCTTSTSITFDVVTVTFPSGGGQFVVTGPTVSGVTPGYLSGVSIVVYSASGCSVSADGNSTVGSHTGRVSGEYENSKGWFVLSNSFGGGDALQVSGASGCGTLVATGDQLTMGGVQILRDGALIPQINAS